jgi:hypothetical protein
LFFSSTATVSGRDRPVRAPWIVRTGASSPDAAPRKITMAAASGLGAMISSFVLSYAIPCVVRLKRVNCP